MADPEIQTECALFDARVGDKALIELSGTGDRFSSEFTGWEKGRYIQVRLPSKLPAMDHVYPDKPVIVRYLRRGGEVHAFQSTILCVLHTPFRLLFLDYPRMVEKLTLRKKSRADCFLPARFDILGDDVPGYLLNISQGGARGSIAAGRLKTAPQPGEILGCRFLLHAAPNDEIDARAAVRRIQETNGKCLLSMQFTDLAQPAMARVDAYVRECLEYAGAGWACAL